MKQDDESIYGGRLELPGESAKSAYSKPRKRFPRFISIAVVIIFLALAGFLAWNFFMNGGDQAEQTAVVEESQPEDTQTSDVSADVPPVTDTKTHTGDKPRVEVTYPTTWTVKTSEDGLRLVSPDFNYQDAEGNDISGNFRIYIRQGAREIDSQYIGRGFAASASEKLVYGDPAVGQREETNISFFGLDRSDNFGYFLIAGNFALEKGDTLGPNYGEEPTTYIITGGYSSNELEDDLATNPVSLDYYDQTSAYRQALEIIKSLKLI